MSRKTKRTRARDKRFFEALDDGATIGEAAKIAGYSRRSIYDYSAEDPSFAQQLDDSRMDIVERLEKEADRRAMEGVTDFKSIKTSKDQYKVIPFVKYSDSLLMFRLKALAPEKYRDNYKPPELPDELEDVSIEDITTELGKTLMAFMDVEDLADDDADQNNA
ncbi:Whole genome shotgun sequence [Vibrio owensii]|uniref:Whole genome shotgun sequence n=1 Tax=Vibrio owensii TaxID=696485 RepID=A0AAU9Q023_9VIBR|nr:Whole genome shotgun sequence [Vibrio owensii]